MEVTDSIVHWITRRGPFADYFACLCTISHKLKMINILLFIIYIVHCCDQHVPKYSTGIAYFLENEKFIKATKKMAKKAAEEGMTRAMVVPYLLPERMAGHLSPYGFHTEEIEAGKQVYVQFACEQFELVFDFYLSVGQVFINIIAVNSDYVDMSSVQVWVYSKYLAIIKFVFLLFEQPMQLRW